MEDKIAKENGKSIVQPHKDKIGEPTRVFKGKYFSGVVYLPKVSVVPLDRDLGWFDSLREIASGRFLSSGNHGQNLREQVTQEHQNTSLISALVMTITAPSVLSIDVDVWDLNSWELGVYQCLMNVATSTLLGGIFLSVFFLLLVHECTNEAELKQFLDYMGTLMEFPMILLILGAGCFGGGLVIYSYNIFPLIWFAPTAVLCNGGMVGCLVPLFIYVVQQMYKAKRFSIGKAMLDRTEVEKAMKAYAHTLDRLECASLPKFKQFMLDELKCCDFFSMTDRKIRLVYESYMKEHLANEYVKPQDEATTTD